MDHVTFIYFSTMYEYMRPRVPIQAMFNSPGPMVYGLPVLCGARTHDPRSIHLKAPAWLFGIKHGRFYNDASPGPVYYPDVHVTRYAWLIYFIMRHVAYKTAF